MKKENFLLKATLGDWSKASKSGQWFISKDEFNNNFKVKIVIDGDVIVHTARKTLAEAIALRDEKIKKLVSQYTNVKRQNNPKKLAASLIERLTGSKKRKNSQSKCAFIYYDKTNNTYKLRISILDKTYINTARKSKQAAIKLRNMMTPTIINSIKSDFGLV
jgi:hypothetical protein